jgi:hypothetical protein
MASPDSQQVLAPLDRSRCLQALLAFLETNVRRLQSRLDASQISRLPELKQDGIVRAIIAVVNRHQVVSPHKTVLGRVVQPGNLLEVMAKVAQQRVVHAQHPLGLYLSAGQTAQ